MLIILWWLARLGNKEKYLQDRNPRINFPKTCGSDRTGQQAGLIILQISMVSINSSRDRSIHLISGSTNLPQVLSSLLEHSFPVFFPPLYSQNYPFFQYFSHQIQNHPLDSLQKSSLIFRILGKINQFNYFSCFLVNFYHKVLHFVGKTKNFREVHICQKENFTAIC